MNFSQVLYISHEYIHNIYINYKFHEYLNFYQKIFLQRILPKIKSDWRKFLSKIENDWRKFQKPFKIKSDWRKPIYKIESDWRKIIDQRSFQLSIGQFENIPQHQEKNRGDQGC